MANSDSFAKTNNKMLFLSKDALNDIRNSDTFNQVRLDMVNGIEPVQCHRCYETERSGGQSKRLYENKKFGWSEDMAIVNKDGSLTNSPIRFVELRLGNTCNLACVTCNSISSSKWIADEKKLEKKLQWFDSYPVETLKWYEDENFYVELSEQLHNVEKIYINGGEPLLVKQHKVLLKRLIAMDVAKNIELEYSTNLTITDPEIMKLWNEFKFVLVQVSIDAVGELNDWIRYGSKFESIQSNLEWFVANKSSNAHLLGCQTISALNATCISEMEEFLSQYGITSTINPVYNPSYFSAKVLTEKERNAILESLVTVRSIQSINTMKSWLEINPYDESERIKLKEFISGLNDIRTVKYSDVQLLTF